MNTFNYLEILKEFIQEIKIKANDGEVLLQMNNTWYHWTIIIFEFRSDAIKIIDWLSYSRDLNLIENIWAYMKKHFVELFFQHEFIKEKKKIFRKI